MKPYFDELAPGPIDYTSRKQVASYDRVHQRFRRYDEEATRIIRQLGLMPESTVIDMGAGTGAFALHAAPRVRRVYAVDVSRAMLYRCRLKAREAGLKNIRFRVGGFLTYRHSDDPVDAMVSVAALHHLPDVWKQVGLQRAAAMVKPGGKFYLFDIVFPSTLPDLDRHLHRWVQGIRKKAGPSLAAEAEVHIREEYSTYEWVMEGLLRRAGFRVTRKHVANTFQTAYLCTRV